MFSPKWPIFVHAGPSYSELPSNISSMTGPEYRNYTLWHGHIATTSKQSIYLQYAGLPIRIFGRIRFSKGIESTVCPRSLFRFQSYTHNIKLYKTSWTYSRSASTKRGFLSDTGFLEWSGCVLFASEMIRSITINMKH